MAGTQFSPRFSIPMLPRDWFKKLEELRIALKFDDPVKSKGQWQVVLLGLHCACEMGSKDPTRVLEIVQEIKEKYPVK